MRSTSIFIVLLFVGCSYNTISEKYRYNPFQFPYPEYYLKAQIIQLDNKTIDPINETTKIQFFGISAAISNKWVDKVEDLTSEGLGIVVKKNNRIILYARKEKETLMGCIDPDVRNFNRDFCSEFKSTKELYGKLFTLTPKDLTKEKYFAKGNYWIVHMKGNLFENIRNIFIYQSKTFVAFRKDYNSNNLNPSSTKLPPKTAKKGFLKQI